MLRSEGIAQLTAALAKAQGEFPAVTKSGKNPTLTSRYATLDDIIKAVRGPLSANGLAFTQPLTSEGNGFMLETLLLHESGEFIGCMSPVTAAAGNRATNALQNLGIGITYMRRYQLSALLGINVEEDTDAEGKAQPKAKAAQPSKSNGDKSHWITDDKARKRFWAWTKNDLVLTENEVHIALGVEHVEEFEGTMQEAKTKIETWIKARIEEANAEPAPEPEPA